MELLWAPWRRSYVQDADSDEMKSECFLCDAGKHAGSHEQTLLLKVSELSVVMLNRFPYMGGHILVAPKRHCSSILELTDQEYFDLMKEVRLAMRALDAEYNPHGFNVGMNLGIAGGAGVPGHVHVHVVPRWTGDTNFMPVVGDIRVLSEDLHSTWTRLSDRIQDRSKS